MCFIQHWDFHWKSPELFSALLRFNRGNATELLSHHKFNWSFIKYLRARSALTCDGCVCNRMQKKRRDNRQVQCLNAWPTKQLQWLLQQPHSSGLGVRQGSHEAQLVPLSKGLSGRSRAGALPCHAPPLQLLLPIHNSAPFIL